MTLKDKIPPIYHAFFPEILDLEIPEEKIATCDNCTICLAGNKSPFIHTKCCNYYPYLANYLVGGILQEQGLTLAEGRRRIRQVISQKKGVSPYSIIPPFEYSKRRKEVYKKNYWDMTPDENLSLRCPYYDDGNCSVWKYRANLCVTFFCTHTAGSSGRVFWDKVNQYLKKAENELSKYALIQLGWPAEEILFDQITAEHLKLDNEEGNLDEGRYIELWRDWLGREEELYIQCHQIIRSIDREKFLSIAGISGETLKGDIFDSHRKVAVSVFPDYLVFNPDTRIEALEKERLRLVTSTGSAEVPSLVFPFIKSFNGKRTTMEVCHMAYRVLIVLERELEKLISIRALLPAANPPL